MLSVIVENKRSHGIALSFARAVIWSLIYALMIGCSSGAHELARVPSPDRESDIVIAEVLTGATTSTPYMIYLVPAGKVPSKEDDLVLKVDNSAQPEVEWNSANSVTLKCQSARVWNFQNFGSVKTPDRGWLYISVSLACGESGYRK
jgi:hypothetical protein